MLTKGCVEYMGWLSISRLIEFINRRTSKELNQLLKNIKRYNNENLLMKKEAKTLQDVLSFIKARLNAINLKGGEFLEHGNTRR